MLHLNMLTVISISIAIENIKSKPVVCIRKVHQDYVKEINLQCNKHTHGIRKTVGGSQI